MLGTLAAPLRWGVFLFHAATECRDYSREKKRIHLFLICSKTPVVALRVGFVGIYQQTGY